MVGSAREGTLQDCVDHLQVQLDRAHEHPRVDQAEMLERLERARRYLAEAVLIRDLGRGP